MSQNVSHLYDGFHYAGALPCIARQRSLQAQLLRNLTRQKVTTGRLLSVGVGWGDELRTLLDNEQPSNWDGIDTIDLAPGSTEAMRKVAVDLALHRRLEHRLMDLADLAGHRRYGEWAVIQCGFVLQDIAYEAKQDIFDLLHGGLLPDGVLLISEMFLDNRVRRGSVDRRRRHEASRLYEVFLSEADLCFATGVLSKAAYDSLRGSDETPGICSARLGALEGVRDFFESKRQIIKHLRSSGFSSVQFLRNPLHPSLGVLASIKDPVKRKRRRLHLPPTESHV